MRDRERNEEALWAWLSAAVSAGDAGAAGVDLARAINAESGAERALIASVDAGGRIVTPGLVSTNSTLSVSEISCADPSCPGTETVILVMRPGERTRAYKVAKAMDAVTEPELRAVLG